MMKKTEYGLVKIPMIVVVLLWTVCCCSFSGCGVRDSALALPIGETAVAETMEAETMAGGTSLLEASEEKALPALIYVYVCGAVNQPGVVKLPEGSRVEDALLAAGGFSEDAKRDYVNLAAKMEDGEKIFFPSEEEAEELILEEKASQSGTVNINTADKTQLMTLPGIGESRAQDIISYREQNGGFQNKEDIKKVSGIKESAYQKLRDSIVVQ